MTTKEPGIVPYGPNGRYEVQADGRRIAVFDDLADAHLFIGATALLAACEAAAEWLSVFPSEGPEFEIATAEEVFSELTAAIAAARQEEE